MKKTSLIWLVAVVILFNINCNKEKNDNNNEDKIIGTGEVISKDIVVSPFHNIILEGVANIYVTIADTQIVIYKAQQEILDIMTYSVVNETFKLGMNNDNKEIETDKEISAEITIPGIESITLTGVGNFELNGEKQSILDIDLTGAGNVYAYNMEVDTCYINLSGVGDCEVRVNNLLDVAISGVGNVKYKGNPTVDLVITGVGNVIDDN